MMRSLLHALPSALLSALLGALLCAPAIAQTPYFQWQMVELPTSSGASCGNGTPYRFFVNRTPLSKSLAITYEGGGACWDQKACLGEGPLSATNPDGIPPDYMQRFDTVAYGLVTPFSSRTNPFQAVQTQNWNLVFMPYCTGDTHTGSAVRIYEDAYPETPRVQYHAGQANARAAAAWLRANLGQPQDLLLTGYSAGGVGSTATYGIMRDALEPTGKASLIADSGPLMPAPSGSNPADRPSITLHETIRLAWGLDEPGGLIEIYAGQLPGFDPNDLGSVSGALALRYPNDRFGYVVFRADTNFSAFSYEKFNPDIRDETNPAIKREKLLALWQPDIARWTDQLAGFGNVGFHVPFFRNFNQSHCLTIIDFSGTGIESAGVASLAPFVDNTLDRGMPMRTLEADNAADYTQPLSGAIRLFKLLAALLGFTSEG